MRRRWIAVFCAVLFAMLIITTADTKAADETAAWNEEETKVQTEGVFTYYIHPSGDGQDAWIYKIEVKGKKVKSLSIPETIQGMKVTRLGCPYRREDGEDVYHTVFGEYIEPWHNADGSLKAVSFLTSVKLPDTVEVIEPAAFSGLDSLTKMEIPQKVKEIGGYTFYGCDKLKTIVLPDQLESFENSALWDCPSLKNMKLSKANQSFQVRGSCLIRKKDKALLFAATGGKKLTIPGGVKQITSYAFRSTKSQTIHIPASVAVIERGAFENIRIKNVTISKKNRVFARDGQCIYKKSDKSLVVAIPNKKRELRISEKVRKLTPEISVVNCGTESEKEVVQKLIYPSRLKCVTVPGFGSIDANNVYFTGKVPPKVIKPKSAAGYAKLPIFCHVYVPKAYEDVYKKWYRSNKCYSYVNGWHTYNP